MTSKPQARDHKISVDTMLKIDALVRRAGDLLLTYWPRNKSKDLNIQIKSDGSPVTDADLNSHDLLIEGLEKILPGEVIISEESLLSDACDVPNSCWFLDPLDGTKPFIQGQDHFAIFLGHKSGSICDFGMMYFPAQGKMVVGRSGQTATCNGVRLKPRVDPVIQSARIVRQGTEVNLPKRFVATCPYPSRNLAYLASCAGELDGVVSGYGGGYVALWDICAMLAVLNTSGMKVVNHDGTGLLFDRFKLKTSGLVVTTPERLEALLAAVSGDQEAQG